MLAGGAGRGARDARSFWLGGWTGCSSGDATPYALPLYRYACTSAPPPTTAVPAPAPPSLPPPPTQAEVRALAKKMLRRKIKDDIIEAAYNRYALWVLGQWAAGLWVLGRAACGCWGAPLVALLLVGAEACMGSGCCTACAGEWAAPPSTCDAYDDQNTSIWLIAGPSFSRGRA